MSKRKPRTGRSVPPKARTAKPARKAWSGRFREQTNRAVESFTSALSFDQRLYAYDIQGSIAHCKALELADVLPHRDASAIIRGLGRFEPNSMRAVSRSPRRTKTFTWRSSGGSSS